MNKKKKSVKHRMKQKPENLEKNKNDHFLQEKK